MPTQRNGELLSYDVHLYSSSSYDHEDVLATVNSDQTYFALSEDQHMYKQSDPLVQVRHVESNQRCIYLFNKGWLWAWV